MSEPDASLEIEGMSCGGCVMSVEKALQSVEGVEKVEVRLAEKRALVWGRGLARDRLVRVVYDAGYDAR